MSARKDAMVGLREWIANNPRAYALIVGWAREDVAAGRRPSTKRYAERIRGVRTLYAGGASYAFDNRMTAPLTRLLVADYPELAPYFPMRHSDQWDAPSCRAYDEITLDAHAGRLFDPAGVGRVS